MRFEVLKVIWGMILGSLVYEFQRFRRSSYFMIEQEENESSRLLKNVATCIS